KKEFGPFEVASVLFKNELADYNKKNRDTSDIKTMGERTKLVRKWYNDLSKETLAELTQVAKKWNQEGAPPSAKEQYRSQHQKNVMEDFVKLVGRTMGFHVVVIAAHDRVDGKPPGTTM
ncbi:hypothetical protein AZE42_13992, partial [Rhizopogon vesiculosus]